MKISETKKLLRDMCRIIGHEYGKFGKCTRCKKKLPFVIWESVGMVVYNKGAIIQIMIDP